MPGPTADAVVVGGGLIGASIALRLAQERLRVVLLDQGEPGREASSAAAGILSPHAESGRSPALREMGRASRDLFPALADELREATGIDIELRLDGVIALGENLEPATEEPGETRPLSAAEILRLEPTLPEGGPAGVFYPRDGQVENVRLTRAVLDAASRADVEIQRGTPARRFLHTGGKLEGVETAGGAIRTATAVNAAGAWAGFDAQLPFPLPIRPARGEIVALWPARAPEHVIYAENGYVVPRRGGRVLLGATMESAGYDKTVKVAGVLKLFESGLRALPDLATARLEGAWAGLRPCAPDHLPILGATPIEGLLVATGHCRNGILLAPITARALADLVVRGSTPIDLSPFAVSRFRIV